MIIQELEYILTERCNLNCTYCYVKQKNTDMSPELFMDSLELLDKNNIPHENKIRVSLFGGEPLLNRDVISLLPEFINKYRETIQYIVLITNFTLLNENIFNMLVENKIGISISWDGPLEIQSRTRPMKGGYKSDIFAERYPKYRDYIPAVKTMLSPLNLKDMITIARYFKDLGVRHIDLTIVRDNIWSDDDIELFEKKINELYEIYIDEKWGAQGITIGLFYLPVIDFIISNKITVNRKYSCFSGTTGCALYTNGDLYPCERFATNYEFKLGSIYEGIGRTADEINSLRVFENAKLSNYINRQKCPLSKFCYASCHYSQLHTNLTVLYPVKCFCKLYKIMARVGLKLYKNDRYFKQLIYDRVAQIAKGGIFNG